jgi:DNA/RNA-binding domain of Phe-tRNA-synthetase-like protein
MMFEISQTWYTAYPAAHLGLLVMREVANPPQHSGLDELKAELETSLRADYSRFDRTALENLPVMKAYNGYYQRFKKTYHVQLQLESIVHKGKTIPRVAALVEAMFMAEVKNQLLTAGHDLDLLDLPASLDVASGAESYTLMRGSPQTLKNGDMFIRDRAGVISSIIYGPDQRTQIRPETRAVIFTVYAPPGISTGLVRTHLEDIRSYVRVVAPRAVTDLNAVLPGDSFP